jgi:hypothetical protein
MLKELQKLPGFIHFPLADIRDSFRVAAVTDASFAPSSWYGKTGFLLWLHLFAEPAPAAASTIASPSYILECSRAKQIRMANYSLGAEILTASLNNENLLGFAQSLASILNPHAVSVRVLVGPPRVRAVRKAYTIVEARMAYRMIV